MSINSTQFERNKVQNLLGNEKAIVYCYHHKNHLFKWFL